MSDGGLLAAQLSMNAHNYAVRRDGTIIMRQVPLGPEGMLVDIGDMMVGPAKSAGAASKAGGVASGVVKLDVSDVAQAGKVTIDGAIIGNLKKEIDLAKDVFQTSKKIPFESLKECDSVLEIHGFQPISKKAYKHILNSHYQDGAKYLYNKLVANELKSVFGKDEHFLKLAIEAIQKGEYVSPSQIVYDFGREIGLTNNQSQATKILINITIEGGYKVIQTIYPF